MAESAQPSPRKRRSSRNSSQETLGRLRRYKINGLFDTFNYDFELDSHGPTLLTGVNGTGKSTILRSIDAVSTGRWSVLAELPFTSLQLEFETRRVFSIERPGRREMHVSLTGEKDWLYGSDPEVEYLRMREQELGARMASITSLGDELALREIEVEYRELVSRRRFLEVTRAEHERKDIPPWGSRLSEMFPVLFITDQRLIIESPNKRPSEREKSTRAAADEVARQIAKEMASAKSAYGNRSQALDHDFPQRVIRTIKSPPEVTDDELRDQLDELTRKSEALEAVGLLAKESVGEFEELDLALANVMPLIQTYIDDSRQKLAVLEPLRVKLQLFSEFLRQHYGRKRIAFDPETGFTILTGTRKLSPVSPSKLSSGEQQMMVLAHQILFKASNGTLVLIDEPELSLHVLWQATFVEDLAEMGKVNNLSFLLATHSPTLIGGREDLKRSLDKMSEA